MNTIQLSHDSETGMLTWTIQQEFKGAIPDSVKEVAEKNIAQLLGILTDAFNADELEALRALHTLNNVLVHAELNQMNTLAVSKAKQRSRELSKS